MSLQSLDQLAGPRGPDVEVSPQSRHGEALVAGQQAGAGLLGGQEDVLGSPGQEQHLLDPPAGRDQPEAGGEGADQEAVVGDEAEHERMFPHCGAPHHLPAFLAQVVHTDTNCGGVLTGEKQGEILVERER